MTCPVPRESDMENPSLDRTERILRWLGFKPYGSYAEGERPDEWFRDGNFTMLSAHISPSLDYLVLEKVRTLSGNARDQFASNLEDIWWKRSETMLALAPLNYLPGDYAEAARFLWEGE